MMIHCKNAGKVTIEGKSPCATKECQQQIHSMPVLQVLGT